MQGGEGGDYISTSNHKHNGGAGGSAGNINGSNQAGIAALGAFTNGFVGIRASSIGGDGVYVGDAGDTNSGQGGFGGTGGSITLNNLGVLQFGTSASPLQVQGASSFEGISAESRGGASGYGLTAKDGAASGNVAVSHSAALNFFGDTTVTVSKPTSIFGKHAISAGGAGAQSCKDKNTADAGGNSGSVTITATAGSDINISGTISASPVVIQGGGIGAFTEGAAGDQGFSGDFSTPSYGGRGGSAEAISLSVGNTNLNISGDCIAGIRAMASGGTGGNGSSKAQS